MDPFIVPISGNAKHRITLDPTVWIFDNRKVDLEALFQENQSGEASEEERGNIGPRRWQTNQIRTKKEALIEGSYGMKLEPFIDNAEPSPSATTLVAVTSSGEKVTAPLETGKTWIAGFSSAGMALKEDGPIHIYFADGTNQRSPVTHVVELRVE
ncbi:peptidyl-prolyl cis-trans isomerase [Salicibibacter halophilus]|uniref:Peptidyl-prolyl cis-trans isomerase n=1 Tax=Salicibibacter halophilus TaxID=2502791 RepID=A0A514LH88_9BACI|nr:peptidyl-prolyl cis-trans isomerase [Salicibibacter halophilus]QDI90641.1 peptidyl-prolyl cis-trans isomerase [Salicibibacter halophilus]